ncbi:ROK family protein [Nocardioides sp. TRM66260-LWL]|uniref:ROK family protein n=1 Tax=Nocardioides sp. TRM66260-LWL TaxID=2874478 RepID=UPI001CC79173|nr:ROK family protein [Nocardioides sp. TRM66260-LWL]MBZ5734299.1 ROK family protein [Nocardioides sp. TRM66260-LWL]
MTPPRRAEGLVVGVDVGGTKVLAAEVDDRARVLATATRSTPGRRVELGLLEGALTEAVEEVADGRPVAAVGLAAAGFVDRAGERVMFAPHLPWRGEAVRARLAERWGTTVVLDNDANCAARAEVAHGEAAGVPEAVVVTLGTGIGGAVVLGGRVHRGRNGMAGEFGHMQVVPDGLPCECGSRGCWEQYSSGNALARFARERIGRERTSLAALCGGVPERLVGPMVTEAAEQGDAVALQAFASVGDWLGVGIANLVAALDPDVVVVGGGVSSAGDLLLEPARAALTRSLVGASHRRVPPVRLARFGPEAGVVGAAVMAREGR